MMIVYVLATWWETYDWYHQKELDIPSPSPDICEDGKFDLEKVGETSNERTLKGRLKTLRGQSPVPLRLLYAFKHPQLRDWKFHWYLETELGIRLRNKEAQELGLPCVYEWYPGGSTITMAAESHLMIENGFERAEQLKDLEMVDAGLFN